MEVMVIYMWQCMVVLLYDCIYARWLWSIMNEHATATINMKGCTLMIDCRGTQPGYNLLSLQAPEYLQSSLRNIIRMRDHICVRALRWYSQ